MVYNPYIIVPFATWVIAQLAKFTIAAFRGRLDLRYLYASGGMPSVHSAVVCSLATTAALVDGLGSHLFGFTAIFAAIVMYDSFGVRRASGEQAAAINMLIDSLGRDRIKLGTPKLHLREILGHQPHEVIIGAITGVVLGGVFNYDRISPFTQFLSATPLISELITYGAIFLFTLIGGIVARLILRSVYKDSQVIRRFTRQLTTATQTIGWVGLIAVLLQYEHASYLAWRFWADLILLIAVIWGVMIARQGIREIPVGLTDEAQTARRLKWLNWGRGKRRKKK